MNREIKKPKKMKDIEITKVYGFPSSFFKGNIHTKEVER